MEISIPHSDQNAEVSLAACLAGKRISLKLLMSLECTNEDCILMQPDKEARTELSTIMWLQWLHWNAIFWNCVQLKCFLSKNLKQTNCRWRSWSTIKTSTHHTQYFSHDVTNIQNAFVISSFTPVQNTLHFRLPQHRCISSLCSLLEIHPQNCVSWPLLSLAYFMISQTCINIFLLCN